ncbi:DNA adenine methylase [Sedimentimonas flavescens]|uniref:DNA adenine methylase n=1 Tax=Sedimentimonas flavescens TaxID=2851012 RepID=UPI001C4A5C68|nr:DNA adenine methylase [Sedimentimonas flavescens]MBW0159693.1 DNA adenine methylase [Sedimentimonas flavescens]
MVAKNISSTALDAATKALARKYLSPLRYPGGKRKLVAHVAAALDRNGVPHFERVIEPFTGGAAVSIALLEASIAEQAILNDLDPLVAAFWTVVFSDRRFELADRILDAKVTLAEWEKQREITPEGIVDKAFKCIFLNRTSFSGSLNPSAGPLGGKAQKSANAIDCRWNANSLAERIWQLGRLSGRVRVHNKDFRSLVGSYRSAHARKPNMRALWYFDPPFFHKADKLYRYWFQRDDHRALKRCLDRLDEPWILSYDSCPEARQMYCNHTGRGAVDMRYTAAKSMAVQKIESAEMIVENLTLRKKTNVSIRAPRTDEIVRTVSNQ